MADHTEIDIVEAVSKCRIGPNGEQIKPAWAMSAESWESEIQTVPLFMKELPQDISNHKELVALQSLLYEGEPNEIALNFKIQGNQALKDGQHRSAIEFYNQGIHVDELSDTHLKAVLYCNRAAVHLELKNYRSCIQDCTNALALDPVLAKAYYRMGRAHTLLESWDSAISAYTKALDLDPKNGLIQVALDSAVAQHSFYMNSHRQQVEQLHLETQSQQAVATEMKRLGIQAVTLSDPNSSDQYASHHPTFDFQTSTLTFPCLVLYPEFNQSDLITHFDTQTTFIQQLVPILDQEPAPWDPDHTYKTCTTAVYFLSFDIDPNKRRLIKVGYNVSLLTVLKSSWARVVNGVVELLVLHRSNRFSVEYVERYRQRANQKRF